MNFGSFDASAHRNRIIEETQNRGYKINYGYVPNTNKKPTSTKGVFVAVFAICGLTYLAWKKVISPTVEFLKTVLDPDDVKTDNDRVVRTKEDKRILSGQIIRTYSLKNEVNYIKMANPEAITDV